MEKEGRTRLALIICNKYFEFLEERVGSETDQQVMNDLLVKLGYSVITEWNLTALEMQNKLKEFACHKEHASSDSTFLVFMSHGNLDGICGKKHSEENPDILHDDIIFSIFNNRNCRNLRDKPKVIIMQACRGYGDGYVLVPDKAKTSTCSWDQPSQLVRGNTTRIYKDAIIRTHVEKDFIAFKSSTPHNPSARLETGSPFISQLTDHIKRYAWRDHLDDIFRKVQRSFEKPDERGLIQMPTAERVTLTRHFYLFPGI